MVFLRIMKNSRFIFTGLILFLIISSSLFAGQYFLSENNIVDLDYRIHFLIFFITLIGLIAIFAVSALGKKDVVGFVFLGFVIFKMFAMGYIALFQPNFKDNIIAYFGIYWLYLLIEVLFVLRLIKKQD